MSLESSDGDYPAAVSRRVQLHAALSDAARLQIIDALALGDYSPGELGAMFGLASNLLAHHVKVLAGAGLVRRARSEGDGRRSYVQLVHENPVVRDVVHPRLPASASRVVFVCTRNSARSQLAAAAWAATSALPVTSAGTHPAEQVHPMALEVARRHGLQMPQAQTRLTADVLRPGDLVVAVCDNAHEELTPSAQLHWAVADPVRQLTPEAFDLAFRQITSRVVQLASALAPRD